MRALFTKLVAAALLALPLAACNAAHGLLGAEPSHVGKVEVSMAPNVGSPSFAQSLDGKVRGQASRFAREGVAKDVRVAVTEVHYKNAAQSLLIGDGNYASAEVLVVDPATGKAQGPVKAEAIDASGLNGMVGAIISVTQDKREVDERLADKLAWNVLVKLYGPTAAKEAGEREPRAIEPMPAADPEKPGGRPKPQAKPAGTPVASASSPKELTAVATPASSPAVVTR